MATSKLASTEEAVQAALAAQQKQRMERRRKSSFATHERVELPMEVVDHRVEVTKCGPGGAEGESHVRVEFTKLTLELTKDQHQRVQLQGKDSLAFAALAQCALKVGQEEIQLDPVLRPLFVLSKEALALPTVTLSLAYDADGKRFRASRPVTLRPRGSAACSVM